MASDRIESEEALIAEFLAPLASGFPGAFNLADDCAAIAPGAGEELLVTTDAVVAGVHFFADEDPAAVAWKALAVNVSDLIAKGATPVAYLMVLALPEAPDRDWLIKFSNGLRRAQEAFGCTLAGGDTDRTLNELSVSITAFGTIPAGDIVRRSGARPGDHVYVSGTIGDATLGLKLRRDASLGPGWGLDKAARDHLDARYRMPVPPVGLALAVRLCASAAMDISDGLMKDLIRLCRASGAGGRIEAARVPLSSPARTVVNSGGATLVDLMTGGEDYEVLAVVRPERAEEFEKQAVAAGTQVTRIGSIAGADDGIVAVDGMGNRVPIAQAGWDHFLGHI
jgi:thiamine-monophosphate kinase